MASDHSRAKDLFLAACELPVGERRAFLECATDGDQALLSEIESLLAYHTGDPPVLSGARRAGGFRGYEVGDRVAGRYRIEALLGHGGMGAVYRAHDDLLDVLVALKVLRTSSPAAACALLNEVRLAREVTHANVCRVFDVGALDDGHFLTMELVEGEDLGALLKRIGRLPGEKVIEVARRLCAGLVAAHAKGVLHRDLKPANIMIDREGRVKITDFGIATTRRDVGGSSAVVGTPAYMAPEQLVAGRAVSERSDVYALGLVLYEMLTGRPVFEGETVADFLDAHTTETPLAPSRLITDVDPGLERCILRMLQKDPADRPGSALDVAAALPGGDALAMAFEAHITPPPELVAASDLRRFSSARAAWALAALLALLALAWLLSAASYRLHERLFTTPPAVLVERAEQVVSRLGYDKLDGKADFGFIQDPTQPTQPLLFWYRKTTTRTLPSFMRDVLFGSAKLNSFEFTIAIGDAWVVVLLDEARRLRYFQADGVEPPVNPGDAERAPLAAWETLLELAGLHPSALETISPEFPPVFADARAAWRGGGPAGGDVFVQAASVRGRPVYFSSGLEPAASAAVMAAKLGGINLAVVVTLPILTVLFVVSIPMAMRNMRRRSDTRSATRLAVVTCLAALASWVFLGNHFAHPLTNPNEALTWKLAGLLLLPFLTWLAYVAFEPGIRRVWPQTLIAWSRLLSGRFRDGAVGRGLLIGAVVGACWAIAAEIDMAAPSWLGLMEQQRTVEPRQLTSALGVFKLLGNMVFQIHNAIGSGGLLLLLLVLLRVGLKTTWLAVSAFMMITMALETVQGTNPAVSWFTRGVCFAAPAAIVLIRFGLLTFVVGNFVRLTLLVTPMTADFDLWFADTGLFSFLVVALLGVLGFLIARRDREATPER